ncbi:Polyamine-modulated factor 1-binding protein 1 [Heracleum sosnowskyi]|uniref:Polyamine-modulated factor 1-binding protein 1 n=1 Tax=Heracleum sosnowskyi TaxID=360622 RepID=A0AAD8N3J8_9APIA|nr:Polyamine-modulated factor 1-binding protein 1 [Heracleum sosnowskyi]
MASSDTQLALLPDQPDQPDIDSPLSSLLYDLSQQVQGGMENMLKMTNEIDQNSAGIMEEIERCKDTASERKKALEEEKDRSAYSESVHFEEKVSSYFAEDLLS